MSERSSILRDVPPTEASPERRTSRAPVLEIFTSIQGEGSYVGEPQTFLRLFGCPLRCVWCDTPGSWRIPERPSARVARPPEAGGVRREPSWMEPAQVTRWIETLEADLPRTVSVTGGEPLIWPDFLLGLRSALPGRRIHLETAGGHPRALARVVDAFDHVSLDLKLPRDLGVPEPVPGTSEPAPLDSGSWRDARRRSLQLVAGRDAALKVVVAGGREPAEYLELLDDARQLAPGAVLVLQPVTPRSGVAAPPASTLLDLVSEAARRGLSVRVVPQVHRLLGLP